MNRVSMMKVIGQRLRCCRIIDSMKMLCDKSLTDAARLAAGYNRMMKVIVSVRFLM